MEKILYLDGDRVFLKKKGKNWRVFYPYKIDGKINWKNFISGGNWYNLLKIAFIVILILGCVWEYSNAVNVANECLNQSKLISLPNLN